VSREEDAAAVVDRLVFSYQQGSSVGPTEWATPATLSVKKEIKKSIFYTFVHSETLPLPLKCVLDPFALGLFCSLGTLKVGIRSGRQWLSSSSL